jgi:hypothetical protein
MPKSNQTIENTNKDEWSEFYQIVCNSKPQFTLNEEAI